MISIIGYGNLSKAIISGLRYANYSEVLRVYDKKVTKRLHNKIILKKEIDDELFESKVILIAVKPKDFEKLSKNINKTNKDTIIVSLMAGITVNKITQMLNANKIARVMTNINSKYGKAMSFSFYNSRCDIKDKRKINRIFKNIGDVHMLSSEKKIDVVTGLIGSGPAYILHFLESLIGVFQGQGFSKQMSNDLCLKLISSTISTCNLDTRTINQIKKSIISKNGTTEVALKTMDSNGFKRSLEKSISAAIKRAKQLGVS